MELQEERSIRERLQAEVALQAMLIDDLDARLLRVLPFESGDSVSTGPSSSIPSSLGSQENPLVVEDEEDFAVPPENTTPIPVPSPGRLIPISPSIAAESELEEDRAESEESEEVVLDEFPQPVVRRHSGFRYFRGVQLCRKTTGSRRASRYSPYSGSRGTREDSHGVPRGGSSGLEDYVDSYSERSSSDARSS